jgi:hypothetical protein
MRTTIKIDDLLLAEAKTLAAGSGRTLNAVIEDALRADLARRRRSLPEHPAIRLPTFKGGHLLPGIDLDDSAALLDRMEGTAS